MIIHNTAHGYMARVILQDGGWGTTADHPVLFMDIVMGTVDASSIRNCEVVKAILEYS